MKKKTKSTTKHKTLLQLLEEKVDVNKLLNSVYLDEDQLIEAALAQPTLQFSAGRFRTQMMHKRIMLETRLDFIKSKEALKWRRIRDQGGKKEFTEPAIKERVELAKRVQILRKKLDTALALEEMSKQLNDVFRTRSDSLRIIVNAGKVINHSKELELLQVNSKMRRSVIALRRSWASRNNEEDY